MTMLTFFKKNLKIRLNNKNFVFNTNNFTIKETNICDRKFDIIIFVSGHLSLKKIYTFV